MVVVQRCSLRCLLPTPHPQPLPSDVIMIVTPVSSFSINDDVIAQLTDVGERRLVISDVIDTDGQVGAIAVARRQHSLPAVY